MHADIAATYALIYRFLKQQAHSKAANAVKKAAEPFVVDSEVEKGPPLEDIIKKWRTTTTMTTNSDAGSSSEASESSDASDSDQSSDSSADESEDASDSTNEDDTSDGSDAGTKSQRKPVERDTSVTLSSAGENGQGTANKFCQTTKKEAKVVGDATKHESTGSESDSSSDSSASDSSDAETSNSSDSSDSDSSDSDGGELPAQNRTETTKAKSESLSESSSESEDESDSESERGAGEKRRTSQDRDAAITSESSSESDESDSEAQQEDVHVAKKRKISDDKAVGIQPTSGSSLKKEKQPPKAKERFQRVKVQSIAPRLLLDNGYQAKGGVTNDYGERAHRDLIVTRGAGFRKEKNKKKRGSYRGGEITLESHSIKFDF